MNGLLRVSSMTACLAVACVFGATPKCFADTIIGNWESGASEGWVDWGTGQLPVVPSIIPGRWEINGIGATVGSKALQFSIAGGNFSQFAALKLQTGNGTAGSDFRPDFLANTRMSFDLTVLGGESGPGGTSFIDMILNADGWGFNPIPGEPSVTPFPGYDGAHGFDASMAGQSSTSTWTYDIGRFHDGDGGNGEVAASPTYVELIFQTYSNATTKYHIDNVRLFTPVPEPGSLTLGLVSMAVVGLLRRRER